MMSQDGSEHLKMDQDFLRIDHGIVRIYQDILRISQEIHRRYPLVNCHIANWNITMFNR